MARSFWSWMKPATLVAAAGGIVLVAAPYAISYLRHSEPAAPYGPDGTHLPLGGYRITVVFDSLTVHNTRDGFFRGDGEYHVAAYVQGVKVPLTEASVGEGICAGWGCPPMMDADEGDTFTFTKGTQVTVNLPKTHPLSIFTAGVELDGCGRSAFPEVNVARVQDDLTLADVFKNPQLDWYHAVESFQSFAAYWMDCFAVTGSLDVLGSINKFYNPPLYGAGQHADLVRNGDFTLRYTITVTEAGAVVQP